MSFIRKIKRKGKTYLAEVENRWVDGRCVQKHLRYIGREADGETVLASSLSHAQVDSVKLYGPLLVLDYLAKEIGLADCLGPYAPELLSLTFACASRITRCRVSRGSPMQWRTIASGAKSK